MLHHFTETNISSRNQLQYSVAIRANNSTSHRDNSVPFNLLRQKHLGDLSVRNICGACMI